MKQSLSYQDLHRQNKEYRNTGGISQENQTDGFLPAFYDTELKRAELARFVDGTPAPLHVLDGVPAEWVTERDDYGRVAAVKASIIAGFIRDGVFYTREQAAYLSSRAREEENRSMSHALVPV